MNLRPDPSGVAFWDTLFQQAAGEGISVFVSSGDSGASGCDASFSTPPASPSPNSPNYICSSSYATCVGGTEFNDASNPSKYWSSSNGNGLSSALRLHTRGRLERTPGLQFQSAGGRFWRGCQHDHPHSRLGRRVLACLLQGRAVTRRISRSRPPAHDGYFACFAAAGASCVADESGNYSFEYFFGTSAAAPDMAGITALLDQHEGGAAGSLNPRLYQMAASVPAAFHDVTVSTSGVTSCSVHTPSMCNNSIAGATTLTGGQAGFPVTAGYDEVTGLGSLDVSAFLKNFGTRRPLPLQFVKVTPCRVVDTRNPAGPFGGPVLGARTSREFDIPQGACNIPSSAVAYSLNVTVVPQVALGYLTIWPSGQPQPVVSTLNSDGRVKANAAITPAGSNGGVSVYVTNETQVILDIDGYFVPKGTASALAFYPVTPCRVVDTRNAVGPLGGPYMAAGTSRAFPVQSSNCGLPADAQVYSLNVTVVPRGPLGYLTMWPSGQAQPLVSTLNDTDRNLHGQRRDRAGGQRRQMFLSTYPIPPMWFWMWTDTLPPPATGGLSLYTTTPCRVLDTRRELRGV